MTLSTPTELKESFLNQKSLIEVIYNRVNIANNNDYIIFMQNIT